MKDWGLKKHCMCKKFHSLLDCSLSVEHGYKSSLKWCWEADFLHAENWQSLLTSLGLGFQCEFH